MASSRRTGTPTHTRAPRGFVLSDIDSANVDKRNAIINRMSRHTNIDLNELALRDVHKYFFECHEKFYSDSVSNEEDNSTAYTNFGTFCSEKAKEYDLSYYTNNFCDVTTIDKFAFYIVRASHGFIIVLSSNSKNIYSNRADKPEDVKDFNTISMVKFLESKNPAIIEEFDAIIANNKEKFAARYPKTARTTQKTARIASKPRKTISSTPTTVSTEDIAYMRGVLTGAGYTVRKNPSIGRSTARQSSKPRAAASGKRVIATASAGNTA